MCKIFKSCNQVISLKPITFTIGDLALFCNATDCMFTSSLWDFSYTRILLWEIGPQLFGYLTLRVLLFLFQEKRLKWQWQYCHCCRREGQGCVNTLILLNSPL